MHAAEDDAVGRRLLRLKRQTEAVADVIGDVLDLADLVVVRQDDRVALLREGADFGLQLGDVDQLEGGDRHERIG